MVRRIWIDDEAMIEMKMIGMQDTVEWMVTIAKRTAKEEAAPRVYRRGIPKGSP